MKMEAWNLSEAKLAADQRNQEDGGLSSKVLDVHNAADEGNVDAPWQHREHVDQLLTATKNTVLSHCPGCCELLGYNKENLNALHIIIADDNTLLPTLKDRSSAKAEMEELEQKKGGSSGRRFSVFKCGKDAYAILKEVKEAHLVMATLIATVTFVAGFAMPGYESEKGGGQARNAALIVFVVTDTLALCMSACSVLMHFYLPGPDAIVLALSSTMSALIFMAIAFISGAYAASGHSPRLAVAACVLGCWYFWAAFFMLGRPSAKAFRRHFFGAATAA